MYRIRDGLTLIELLVVIGIIGVLAAMLLPAVQSSRSSARKLQCTNNLRQVGLAILNYEAIHKIIPSLWNGTRYKEPRGVVDEFYFHSWQTPLLPALEEASLYDRIDISLSPTHPDNQPNLNTSISVLVCPSTPDLESKVTDIYVWPDSDDRNEFATELAGTAARTDYEVILGVETVVTPKRDGAHDQRGVQFGAWGEPEYDDEANQVLGYRIAKMSHLIDGVSKTMLITERAGRPNEYNNGTLVETWSFGEGSMDNHQAAWGISTHTGWIQKRESFGVNQSNVHGPYSFHSSGANVVMADGSVRYLSEELNEVTLNALITRAGNEIVP